MSRVPARHCSSGRSMAASARRHTRWEKGLRAHRKMRARDMDWTLLARPFDDVVLRAVAENQNAPGDRLRPGVSDQQSGTSSRLLRWVLSPVSRIVPVDL